MSSNVVKSNWVVVKEDDTRIIDTNELIALKLEQIKELMKETKEEVRADGFTEGLDAKQVELMLSEEDSLMLDHEMIDLTQPRQEAQDIINQAMEEAEAIKAQAMAEAASLKQDIFDAAKQEGYQKGWEQGSSQAQEEYNQKQLILLNKEQALHEEYEQKLEQMEPVLMDTLQSIYEHVFRVNMDQFKDVIVYLIENTLHSVEGNRNFMIRVSKEDYSYVSMSKQQILSNLIGSTNIDFVEDVLLGKNECLIETEGGIFDCGLGTQLEELGKQLRLLSYEK